MSNLEQFRLSISTEQLISITKHPEYTNFLKEVLISPGKTAMSAKEPHLADHNSLVFISTKKHLENILQAKPAIVIASEKLLPLSLDWNCSVFSTPSISAAMALILTFFDDKKLRFVNGIHPTAAISPDAKLGKNISVGANSVIGPFAEVGDNCIIGPLCNIEAFAKIGAGTVLNSHVFIGARCELGINCEIHAFTCLGSDGFGYVQRPDQVRIKIPQVGKVVLGDNVEIGSGCMIDRATMGETRIGSGTKIDNLCHIAHNVKIGKNGAITAGFNVAGSSVIGDNIMTGGQAGVADHITICDSVTLGARSGVIKDIQTPGAYAGFPTEPMRDAVRTMSSLAHLTDLRKAVQQIQKKLGLGGILP